jgi:PKD repeat protein
LGHEHIDGIVGEPVEFAGTAIDPDPDGYIVLFEWDFDGDGTYDWDNATAGTETGTATHVYELAGTYYAKFRATDNRLDSSIGIVIVSVKNRTDAMEIEEQERERGWWETWEPIVTVLTIIGTACGIMLGYMRLRKKRAKLRGYLQKIDTTYNLYRATPSRCEQHLNLLKGEIKRELDAGKLEEAHYMILKDKLNEYLLELKASRPLEVKSPYQSGEFAYDLRRPWYGPSMVPEREAEVTSSVTAPKSPEILTEPCPYCGTNIRKGWVICPGCNQKLR